MKKIRHLTKLFVKICKDNNNQDVIFETQYVSADSGMVTEPSTVPVASKLLFEKWYSDENLSSAFDFTSSISGDTTLYAGWAAKGGYIGDNDRIRYELSRDGKTLTFSGSGEMPDYDGYGDCPWGGYNDVDYQEVEKVIIGDGITKIGKSNFEGPVRK